MKIDSCYSIFECTQSSSDSGVISDWLTNHHTETRVSLSQSDSISSTFAIAVGSLSSVARLNLLSFSSFVLELRSSAPPGVSKFFRFCRFEWTFSKSRVAAFDFSEAASVEATVVFNRPRFGWERTLAVWNPLNIIINLFIFNLFTEINWFAYLIAIIALSNSSCVGCKLCVGEEDRGEFELIESGEDRFLQ